MKAEGEVTAAAPNPMNELRVIKSRATARQKLEGKSRGCPPLPMQYAGGNRRARGGKAVFSGFFADGRDDIHFFECRL
jgi:hypothetical protein